MTAPHDTPTRSRYNGHDPETLKTAELFESWGIDWIWYEDKSKNPNTRGTGWEQLPCPDLQEAERIFRSGPHTIGAHLRRKLADVDADWIEAARALSLAPLRWRLSETTTWGRDGKPYSHLLYFLLGSHKSVTWKDPDIKGLGGKLLEFRVKGQSVAPGSFHEKTGEPIRFEPGGRREPVVGDPDEIVAKLNRTCAVALCARYWIDGSRQDTAGPLAGLCYHGGMDQASAEEFIAWVCAVAGDDEVDKRLGYVRDTYQNGNNHQHIAGGPTLVAEDCFSQKQVRKLREWLGLKAKTNASADLLGPDLYPLTGNGDGDRFAAMWDGQVLYCAGQDAWYIWDERRFKLDEVNEVRELAKLTVAEFRRVLGERQSQCGQNGIATYRDCSLHAVAMDAPGAITAMLHAAMSKKEIRVAPDELNSNPDYLTTLSGTLELDIETGAKVVGFHLHRPEDRITWLAPVHYNPQATHRLVDQVFTRFFPEQDRREFWEEFAGYTLHGHPKRHSLQYIGEHDTGKTTMLKMMKAMLGDYAASLASTNITRNPHKGGDVGRPDLMRVKDKRLVIVTEVEQSAALDVPLFKAILSGGDPYGMRTFFDKTGGGDVVFKFTLWLSGNKPYGPPPDDPASLDRMEVLDCTHMVPESERDGAEELALTTDQDVLDALFAVTVRGFLRLYGEKDGILVAPKSSVDRKAKLIDELDRWSEVITDVFVPTTDADKDKDGVMVSEAWKVARQRFVDSGGRTVPGRSRAEFEASMERRGYVITQSTAVFRNNLYWKGVRLREPE